jgi:D-3-phosphoglycerate dehydrogenase / 2-oxoglutarate reductase
MHSKKILITDKVHPLLIDGLKEMGYAVNYDTSVDMSTLPSIIHEYQGAVINSKIVMSKEVIDLAPNLKFIGRLGSGMEIIDVPYAKSKGIAPINSPEGNRNAVAEHAIGMILAFYNHLFRANAEVKNLTWHREENRGLEMKNRTVGIIGFGHTGSTLAKKLQTWEMTILAHDKYVEDFGEASNYVQKASIAQIQQEADIISFHLPLNKETKHFASGTFFEDCKKNPLIVNTSRGNVIETNTLIKALESKSILGACLDVFENEKASSYTEVEVEMYRKLYSFSNVLVSPHIAGWTAESLERIASVLLDKIKVALAV